MHHSDFQAKTFLLLLVLVSVAFGWILMPFFGAIFWGAVLAILFAPFHRRIVARLGRQRPVLAALATLGICLVVVIIPDDIDRRLAGAGRDGPVSKDGVA